MPGDGNVLNESLDMTEDGEGTDGVTSEGEKVQSSEGVDVEEGREAEASTSTIHKLRNREIAPQTPQLRDGSSNRRGAGRHSRRAITWTDNGRQRNNAPNTREGNSPARGGYQQLNPPHTRGTSRGRRAARRGYQSY